MLVKIVAICALCSSLTAQSPQSSRSIWDGVYSDEQAKRGRPLYDDHCASCHGAALEGGESAPALAGGDFLSGWDGLTVGDLFERIRTTMPQNKPRTLSREVNADIIAFIFSANQLPIGKTELPRAAEVLKEIRIQANKPERK
jgi:mono/diheme cytochrome c family protein